MSAHSAQVLVVGGGPVGLMLAGELRLGGADVVVIERHRTPTTESRASTLHARTMEILDCRGLCGMLGTVPREPRGHFGGIPLDLTLPSPVPGQWKVPQTTTAELLERWALSLGADIRRGHDLRALTVTEDHVEAEAMGPGGAPVTVRAEYAVACDGEDSTVRRLTGAAFPGHDARRRLLRADIAGIDIAPRRFERLADGFAVAARRPDGVTRVMVHEFGSRFQLGSGEPEFDDVVEAWKRVTGEDLSHGTPLWIDAFGDAGRQLAHYRDGRLLYAGDAAHQQMPIGGQALNLGLQDAVNLGWKLAATVRGGAPAGLLDSYHAERHAVGSRVLANIETQAGLLLGTHSEATPHRTMLSELIVLEDVRAHLAGMISGLDVRYEMPGAPAHELLGARMPWARLAVDKGESSTFELLRAGRGVLLGLDLGVDLGPGPGGQDLAAIAAPWADRVEVMSGALVGVPEERGQLGGARALLVRPDGHVAWAAREGAAGLTDALSTWFGKPLTTSGEAGA
ncbi:FAD-dependent monooxygenase [Streptomyces sp. NPDC041068]|uniref:FAD-dependent monooxygenase n=1 Tax=Streptomyces sp. NPDC041068 TaxID=3155130 RepID=UPI0033C4D2F1